jgi:hypothetical protein
MLHALLVAATATASAAAPADCGPDFWDQLRARSPHARSSTAGLGVQVSFDDRGGSILGRVALDGTERSLSGTRCSEVAGALALIAAMAIERRDAAPPPAPPAPPPPGPAPRPGLEWSWWAGIDGGAAFGLLPAAAPAGGAFAELAREDGLAIRLAVLHTQGKTAALAGGGSAFFAWTGLRATGCAPSLGLAAVEARGCLILDGALIDSSASGVPGATAALRPYAAPGGEAQLSWRPTAGWRLELHGGFSIPLTRDRFLVAPDTTLHEVPPITGHLSAATAVSFW